MASSTFSKVLCSVTVLLTTAVILFFPPMHVLAQENGGKALAANRVVALCIAKEDGRLLENDSDLNPCPAAVGALYNSFFGTGFEPVYTTGHEQMVEDLNNYLVRAREDSFMAAKQVTTKYNADTACIMRLNIFSSDLNSGKYRKTGMLGFKCFDAAGTDLGVSRDLTAVKDNDFEALALAALGKELGAEAGKEITRTLADNMLARQKIVFVTLSKVSQYKTVQVFNNVLRELKNSGRGIAAIKQLPGQLTPDKEGKNFQQWRLILNADTEMEQLQHVIMTGLENVAKECMKEEDACKDTDQLRGIIPGKVDSQKINFVVYRNRME